MRLVLSRKGFDARHGGIASPVLPDGQLLPLPIPHGNETTRLADLPLPLSGAALAELLSDLSHGRIGLDTPAHADPQLLPPPEATPPWRPNLGQAGAAAAHLQRQGVGCGDLFLFFGWFRRVERHRGRWRYVPGAADEHRIFGWLDVGAVLPLGREPDRCTAEHPWIAGHPHLRRPDLRADRGNTLYVAAERCRFAPLSPGGGRFVWATRQRRLTDAAAAGRSDWRLPGWFLPRTGPPLLSYHGDPALWRRQGESVLLRAARIGQEFVIPLPAGPEPQQWLAELIGTGV